MTNEDDQDQVHQDFCDLKINNKDQDHLSNGFSVLRVSEEDQSQMSVDLSDVKTDETDEAEGQLSLVSLVESKILGVAILLEQILENLDGSSAINLANASSFLFRSVHAFLSGSPGTNYWTERCDSWQDDPLMLRVLASYDPVFPKIVNRQPVESRIEFHWHEVYRAAHDVVSVIRSCDWTIINMKEFQDRIKTDLVMQYDPDSFKPDYPYRVTRTCGPLIWNILCPATDRNNPETVLLFDEERKCRQASVADHATLSSAVVMTLPRRENVIPSVRKEERSLVRRLLLTVGPSSVVVSPIYQGLPCVVPLEPFRYEFPKYKMEPLVTHFRDYLAIWSDPYSLFVYQIIVADDGNINVESRGSILATEIHDRGFMGRIWSQMVLARGGFIFALETILIRDNPAESVFKATVTFPRNLLKYCIKIQCRPEITRESITCCTSDMTKIEDTEDEADPLIGTAFEYGLRIYYTSQVLGVSKDGIKWYFRLWNDLKLTEDVVTDVTIVEIFGQNLLAVVCEEVINIVLVSLVSLPDEPPDELFIELEIVRKIDLQLAKFRGHQIKSLHLDFDRGNPFIWLETNPILFPDDGEPIVDDDPRSFNLYRVDLV